MVELDHTFENGKPVDHNWDAILDLDRIVPCVQGGRVVERTSPRRPTRSASRARRSRS